jgi:hypothetical protein
MGNQESLRDAMDPEALKELEKEEELREILQHKRKREENQEQKEKQDNYKNSQIKQLLTEDNRRRENFIKDSGDILGEIYQEHAKLLEAKPKKENLTISLSDCPSRTNRKINEELRLLIDEKQLIDEESKPVKKKKKTASLLERYQKYRDRANVGMKDEGLEVKPENQDILREPVIEPYNRDLERRDKSKKL